ncbi:protein WHAT'S THIS FACTOR 1, chloroplastic [Miscanthus floridulus]|uniref:protein WHAT'S THIS FACTOR 1, chloroplastic n=1 Tax=Miscanthus floridulus TaxID=154761 RepID=UPI003457A899
MVVVVAPSPLCSFLPAHPFGPARPRRPMNPTAKPLSLTLTIRCAATTAAGRPGPPPLPPPKLVRCATLDRQAARASRLRFARKLLTLLLSKPRHFLPLRVLNRCRRFLGLPRRGRPLIPMVLRYPALFRLFQAHTSLPLTPSLSTLAVALTPAAEALAADLAALRATSTGAGALADKVHRLLLMTPRRSIPVNRLVHLAPDLGLAMDFRATLCPRHPDLFRLVNTSRGHALQLADPPPTPPPPFLSLRSAATPDRLMDRPRRFPHLPLRRGLNLRRAHRDYLLRFHSLPEVSPFESLDEGASLEMLERRACAVVREVLAMTVEKRTLVDHLTHFRKDFGLPNRLRAMLVRHPELFYVSVKGVRHSVFLVEAFDDDGRLLVEDEMLVGRDRLEELVREGKRMRRARKKGVLTFDGDSDEDEDDEAAEVEGSLEVDDEFGDLFEDGVIGEDWEEVGGGGSEAYEEYDAESGEMEEFWVKKAVAQGLVDDGNEQDVW